MTDRADIAAAAAQGLRQFSESVAATPVMIGFDGFVDSIIRVVDKRTDTEHYEPINTIGRFGQKVLDAAGQSSNYELITTLRKLGGNGPIMANAMATAGFAVTYVGALGHPQLDPVFVEFGNRAEAHSVANPGATDALEFNDGKLMLGKYAHLAGLDDKAIRDAVGADTYRQIVGRSRLVGMVNWTMLPGMSSIWRDLIENILPAVGDNVDGHRRLLFIDLADPEKRTRDDLHAALELMRELDRHADVILGLNLKESEQVTQVLGVAIEGEPGAAIESIARGIREALDIHGTVVHPRTGAAAALRTGDAVASARFQGPFVARPKLSTGAGDNFNAGFCLGRLADLSVEQCLCAGCATSGYYVRHAASPTLDQLADFCDALPAPES